MLMHMFPEKNNNTGSPVKKEKNLYYFPRTGCFGRRCRGKHWRDKSSRRIGRSRLDQRLRLKPCFLGLCQCSHWIPGRKYDGLLLHHFKDIRSKELLVYHHLIHVLWEPVVCHDEVTYRDGQKNTQSEMILKHITVSNDGSALSLHIYTSPILLSIYISHFPDNI